MRTRGTAPRVPFRRYVHAGCLPHLHQRGQLNFWEARRVRGGQVQEQHLGHQCFHGAALRGGHAQQHANGGRVMLLAQVPASARTWGREGWVLILGGCFFWGDARVNAWPCPAACLQWLSHHFARVPACAGRGSGMWECQLVSKGSHECVAMHRGAALAVGQRWISLRRLRA